MKFLSKFLFFFNKAAQCGNIEVVQIFYNHGADINFKTKAGKTAAELGE